MGLLSGLLGWGGRKKRRFDDAAPAPAAPDPNDSEVVGSYNGLPEEIEPREVKALMDQGENVLLIDVRTQNEWNLVHIDGARLIPLDQIHANPPEDLDREARIVVHCHHGMRSYDAMQVLRSVGYDKIQNMAGGIDSWAEQVEPDMPRY